MYLIRVMKQVEASLEVRQRKSRGFGSGPPKPNHEEEQVHGEPDRGDPQ